jgi:hypothetical protein
MPGRCGSARAPVALLAAGVPRVVAIFRVQGWSWEWAREVRGLVFALDADAEGQQQWRQLARQAALGGQHVAILPPEASSGFKDASEAWGAGLLTVGRRLAAATAGGGKLAVPAHLREAWEEQAAIMMEEGGVPPAAAERLAWEGLPYLAETR